MLDLSDETGRFAGKLLAEAGADVVRLQPGDPGSAMLGAPGGLLDWWYDGGTTAAPLDLTTTAGRDAFLALAERADVLLESGPPGLLARHGLGPAVLAERNRDLVHVALSPFGADGPRADWQASDLVAAAAGGMLEVNGLPDEPVSMWGRQMANLGGFYLAVCALAGLARTRRGGGGLHFDLSLQQVVASCTDHLLMFWWFPEKLEGFGAPAAGRQGSLHWSRAYDVVPCARGWCMVSPTAGGVADLVAWLREEGLLSDLGPGAATDFSAVPKLMAALGELAGRVDATELFEAGQARHVPFGEVLTVPQVAACPQHAHRGFLRPVGPSGLRATMPGPMARYQLTPCPPPAPPPSGLTDASEVLERWTVRDAGKGEDGPAPAGQPRRRPLDGLRVLDLTHVLAGPFATRLLADLGADVVKVQTESQSQGIRSTDFPYFPMWNRSKRSFCLDMSHPAAREHLRRLVEQSDVLIENFSVGVLDRWGAGWPQLSSWNPRLVYVAMSGAGRDGPWRDHVTYAPTVHALCGLTALTGPEGRVDCGPGIALNDHASGLAGAFALLTALEVRERTGVGQFVDLSQLEVGTYLVGPALLDWSANGREAVAGGTRDAFTDPVPNDVVPAAGGRWLAVTARDDAEWAALAPLLGLSAHGELTTAAGRRERRAMISAYLASWAAPLDPDEAAGLLQGRGVPAYPLQGAAELTGSDPQLAWRDWVVQLDSPAWGTQPTDRFPAFLSDAAGPIELVHTAAPYLGQHTFEVAAEMLGLDDAAVATGIADGLFN